MEDVIKEVRRQGKAAVAAQAAAEASLQAVEALSERLSDSPSRSAEEARRILEGLLPVFDALDRIGQHVRRPKTRRDQWMDRLRLTPSVDALNEGIRLLRAQLDATLKGLDIEVDRRVGVPFDPEAHRAIEVQYRPHVSVPTVTEVVAAGYCYRGQRLREADVVVAQSKESTR